MTFYRQVHLAITDFGFYAETFEQPVRASLRYLLYLAAHTAAILTLYYAWTILPATGQFLDWAAASLPPMRLESGVLTLDPAADPPVKEHFDGDRLWTIVIDTTGTYRDTRGLREPAALLTRERLFVRLPGGSNPPPLEWKDVPDISFPADMAGFRRAFNWGFFPAVYSVGLMWSLIFKALQALLLAPLAMSVASLYGVRMPLSSAFTIALYSLTPAVVIDLGVRWTGLVVSYFDLLYLAIAGIYTYMAAKRCSMAR